MPAKMKNACKRNRGKRPASVSKKHVNYPTFCIFSQARRQQLKQIVVCLACRRIISTSWAGWLINRIGVGHDRTR